MRFSGHWWRDVGTVAFGAAILFVAGCSASKGRGTLSAPRLYDKTVLARGDSLTGAIAVVARPDGDSVFVVDGEALRELDGKTGVLRGTLTPARNPALSGVQNLAASGSRLIMVAGTDNHVQILDTSGEPVLEDHRGFAEPTDATFYGGELLVAEQRGGSITRRRTDTADTDVYVTGMRVPGGLAATARDLWVADWASGTILQLVADGIRLTEPIEIASGLAQPEGLAVTPYKSLIVVETGAQRLTSIDLESRRAIVIDENLPVSADTGTRAAPIGRFSGVAVGRCGIIYAVADRTGEILRYTPHGRACE